MKKKLRLLKRVPPILGVCEGCLAQFKSTFTRAIAAEAEIRVRFAAHKCVQTDHNPPLVGTMQVLDRRQGLSV
jgi:hypothetical protein